MHAWGDADHEMRLVEQSVAKDDPDPKALACYGVLMRWTDPQGQAKEEVWLRFVDGRPVSSVTTAFLAWTCAKLEALEKKVWVLPWDNASWHISKEARGWIRSHNRQVKREGKGVRIMACYLPSKSPWLNPIEPKWVHGKRKVVEPDRLLSAQDLADRVCAHFHCPHEPHLAIPEKIS